MGRRLGQHFLHDPGVLDAIVAAAAPAPGEPVLEIGPGEGALTARLLETGARVAAVELDDVLAGRLEARWSDHPGFRLLRADARRVELAPRALFGGDAPYAVVANLPYYLSTPLLLRFVRHRAALSRLVLMVQREVAARITAGPEAGKDYGSLSVVCRYAFGTRTVRRVSRGAFRPPPRVDSAVVALTPRAPVLEPAAEAAFLEHVKRLFSRRRKVMLTALTAALEQAPPAARERVEALVQRRRPDALTPAEHLEVFRLLHAPS